MDKLKNKSLLSLPNCTLRLNPVPFDYCIYCLKFSLYTFALKIAVGVYSWKYMSNVLL